MGLPVDNNDSEARLHEDTRPDIKRQPTDENKNPFLILRIFKYESHGWDEYEVFSGTNRIKIGQNADECDFAIADKQFSDTQVVITPVGGDWYITDIGKRNLMRVNGVLKRQGILKRNDNCVITIRGAKFILNTNLQGVDSIQRSNVATNDLILVQNNIASNYSFKDTLLVGSGSYCDIKIAGEEYAAVISTFNNRVCLMPLTGNSLISVKDFCKVEKTAVNLLSNDSIQFNGEELRVLIPSEKVKQRFNFVSSTTVNRLCLTEIVDDHLTDNVLPLPESGTTVQLGRDPNTSVIVVEGVKLSRRHAEITSHDSALTVTDLNSHNGTYVNGKKIIKTTVYAGNIVQFGDRKFLICFAD